ncbi:gag protease polyprotein [Cucumis melo var. makuwa]|nr:gag protease polyprotein [Cucumis melo var. makuwa]
MIRYHSSDSTGSSQPDRLSASSAYATDQFVIGVPLGHRRPDFVPTGSHVTRVRERASSWVRARASWRATRSDRVGIRAQCSRFCRLAYDENMSPRRGARQGGGRGGRGAGRIQPEEQPAVQAANPNAPVTQADLAAMKQRYQDMLQAALAPFLAAQQI